MSKPKIIAIVGGGITGCVSALYAAKKNLNVHLIEKDKNLGGILKDVSFQGHNYYRACQYFNPESKWYREIPFKELDLINFDHDKATYTDIFNEKSFEKDIAGPVIRTDFKFKKEINKSCKHP